MLVLLLVSIHPAGAQSEAKPPNKKKSGAKEEALPPTLITIVALGPKPPRRYKETPGGEAPTMLLPVPGETPPSRLYFKGKSASDKKAGWKLFNVSFNNPSAMKKIAPEKALTLYQKKSASGEDSYIKYVTIPPGKVSSRRVFFLIPSTSGKKLWNKPPLIRTINLDAAGLNGKQFVLKNLSSFTVLHAFDDAVTAVPPMKTISYTRPKSGELYRLAARYGSRKKIIYNTAVRLDGNGNIQLFALYNASPKTNSGRSVGVFRMMIPARVTPEVTPEETKKP